jgi:hypothetical protein
MHPPSRAKAKPESSGQTFPKLSAFAKLLREHIGNWDNVPDNTATPPTETAKKFREEFGKLAAAREPKSGTITADNVVNWWQGKTRPHWKNFEVIADVLLEGGKQNARYGALKAAWTAADVKEAGRRDKATVKTPPAEEPGRPATRYASRPRRPKSGISPVVGMAIDFVGLGQGMIEDGLPVVLDLSWGFEDDFDVPCRLYLKEFHLIAGEENCAAVPGSFYEGEKTPGLEVTRNGNRWVFKAQDGFRLEGKFKDMDRLFTVKPILDSDGPATVRVEGRCPSASGDHVEVVWPKEASDLNAQQQAVIGRFVGRCQERAKTGSTDSRSEGAGEIPIKLGWVGVSLVEREP